MRNATLDRTLKLLIALTRGRRTLASLAEEYGVCTRTIRRDVEALAEAGFAVQRANAEDDGVEGVWSCDVTCGLLCAVCKSVTEGPAPEHDGER